MLIIILSIALKIVDKIVLILAIFIDIMNEKQAWGRISKVKMKREEELKMELVVELLLQPMLLLMLKSLLKLMLEPANLVQFNFQKLLPFIILIIVIFKVKYKSLIIINNHL